MTGIVARLTARGRIGKSAWTGGPQTYLAEAGLAAEVASDWPLRPAVVSAARPARLLTARQCQECSLRE